MDPIIKVLSIVISVYRTSHIGRDKYTNMLCVTIVLIAAVSCGAREISSSPEPEEYNITTVPLDVPSSTSDSRIIGGSPTTIQNYPFTLQILYYNQLLCGGSLITRRHVLSAAHCFIDQRGNVASPAAFSVRVGSAILNTGGRIHYVSVIVVHERYNIPLRNNDVAVLLLSSRVSLGTTVQTAAIPVAGANLPDHSIVVAVGWGRTNVNIEAVSSVLNEVSVRTVDHSVCEQNYLMLQNITGDPYPITNTMLCAGLLNIGGADACQGDSGGPLIYNGVVVGITSWGYGCAMAQFPGVYARVSSYTPWINQTVIRFNNAPMTNLNIFTTLLIPLLLKMLSG